MQRYSSISFIFQEGYVHRLIQNRIDGKLIEIDDPTTIEERSTLARNEGPESFVKMLNKKSYQQKLNDLNYEYNLLLVSQVILNSKLQNLSFS